MNISYKNNAEKFRDIPVGTVFCAYGDIFMKTPYIGSILGIDPNITVTEEEEQDIELARATLCNSIRLSTGGPAHFDGYDYVAIYEGIINFSKE